MDFDSLDWSLEDLEEMPGYGTDRVAVYECSSCGHRVPQTFVKMQTTPPETLATALCGSVFGGCGEAHEQTLVSDGYVDQ